MDEQVRVSHNNSIEDNFVFLFSAAGGQTTARLGGSAYGRKSSKRIYTRIPALLKYYILFVVVALKILSFLPIHKNVPTETAVIRKS